MIKERTLEHKIMVSKIMGKYSRLSFLSYVFQIMFDSWSKIIILFDVDLNVCRKHIWDNL